MQPAAAFHKIPPGDIWAFHDELDLVPGKVRVKRGGGAAGHNGLRDMQRALGTPDFWRVRLGIGHPGHKDRVHGHVLGNFAKVDTWVEPLLDAVADAAPLLAAGQARGIHDQGRLPDPGDALMEPEDIADFAAGMGGGPGPEDIANGAAALAAALVREAQALAAIAAALRQAATVTPGDPTGGPLSDIRRQRGAMAASGEAAIRRRCCWKPPRRSGRAASRASWPGRSPRRRSAAAVLPAALVPSLRAAALSLGDR